MICRSISCLVVLAGTSLMAQEAAQTPPAQAATATTPASPDSAAWHKANEDLKAAAGDEGEYTVSTGTKIPLSLINSVSTKSSAAGEKIYLETVFPILSNGKIVIPTGSYVEGTITQVKRPGKIKGRGEIYLRFDTLILPNGVMRDFRGRVGSYDGRASEEFDKEEGRIRSEGNKSGDARTVAETTRWAGWELEQQQASRRVWPAYFCPEVRTRCSLAEPRWKWCSTGRLLSMRLN
jgi:hypothetical protein